MWINTSHRAQKGDKKRVLILANVVAIWRNLKNLFDNWFQCCNLKEKKIMYKNFVKTQHKEFSLKFSWNQFSSCTFLKIFRAIRTLELHTVIDKEISDNLTSCTTCDTYFSYFFLSFLFSRVRLTSNVSCLLSIQMLVDMFNLIVSWTLWLENQPMWIQPSKLLIHSVFLQLIR